jgi:FkbM family methyltransferase
LINKIYNFWLSRTNLSSRTIKIIAYVKQLISKIYDPEVRCYIEGKQLHMNFSHMLPIYKKLFPLYDTAIIRIMNYLRAKCDNKEHELNVIDVGANIGDTAAHILASENSNVNVICVEGNEKFIYFLKKNYANNNQVHIIEVFLADYEQKSDIKVITKAGTASLLSLHENEKSNTYSNLITLDNAILTDDRYKNIKIDFVKVDTDGYDYKVLRGAKQILAKYHPLVLFELDPFFLKNHDEIYMSIFKYFKKLSYKSIILYDNFGYPIGLFDFGDLSTVGSIMNYMYAKNMYLDVLVSVDNLKNFWMQEVDNVSKILNKDNMLEQERK